MLNIGNSEAGTCGNVLGIFVLTNSCSNNTPHLFHELLPISNYLIYCIQRQSKTRATHPSEMASINCVLVRAIFQHESNQVGAIRAPCI